ncbi:tyrosine-type recombinase/integrase [Kitasatospora cheerisanensis]|uniref:Tyr recombinase domain-containing protein n=1 Tax=Kitasatospora cheerisanensis KCTC 2395 TaxID=1348663 RepID=A0A066YTX4_9ACTN|nr:hypothetical protein [Kitasatospora cheerisanensis]KDN83439.1 hypothetical protein KCH_49210 [Kitasatospora cheerisanensis KCTC 2395]
MAYAEKRGKYWRVKFKLPNGKYGSASEDDFGNRFTTEREAEQYGQALEADARRGRRVVNPRSGKLTFRAFATDWLDASDLADLSDQTYRSRVRAQLIPEWGDYELRDITLMSYRAWKKRLARAHETNYVNSLTALLRLILEDAVDDKLIDSNPVPFGRKAKRGRYVPPANLGEDEYVHADPHQILCASENARCVRDSIGYTMIMTIAYAQLRMGEVAGLLKDRVWLSDDPYGSAIRVDYQGHYLTGKGWTLHPPKYGSYRTLPLPPFLAELLRSCMDLYPDSPYMFPSITGRPLRVDDQFYGEFWNPIIAGRPAEPRRKGTRGRPALCPVPGIEGMVPHGGRHSGKVWMDEDGHPRVAVEERMGHRDRSVEGTYSHVTPEMRRRIAVSLQARYERSLGVAQTLWATPGQPDLPNIAQPA